MQKIEYPCTFSTLFAIFITEYYYCKTQTVFLSDGLLFTTLWLEVCILTTTLPHLPDKWQLCAGKLTNTQSIRCYLLHITTPKIGPPSVKPFKFIRTLKTENLRITKKQYICRPLFVFGMAVL